MRRGVVCCLGVAAAIAAAFVGCSSDDDTDAVTTSGPTSGSSSAAQSSSATTGTGGTAGEGGAAGMGGIGGMGGTAGMGGMGGGAPGETNCGNGTDDDGDGDIDCEDAVDCGMDAACPLAATCTGAPAVGPTQNGDTTSGTTFFSATCTGDELAPEVVYSYAPAANGVLQAQLTSTADLGLYARSACADPATELGCSDGLADEALDIPVVMGSPIAIFVDGHTPVETGTFTLTTTFVATTEIEPNGTTAQGNTYVPAPPFTGTIYPAGDQDFVKVVTLVPNQTITAEIVDLGSGACLKNLLDSEVEILGTDGTTILDEDDDAGDGFCSKASAMAPTPGTYFVRVSAGPVNPNFVFGYELDVTLL